MLAVFAAISVILTLVAGPPYIVDILRKKTKPQRATWFIFSVLGVIGFVSQAELGVNWSLAFLGLDALGSLGVFALSIRFGVGGFTRLDRYTLAVAAAGAIISVVERRPLIALIGIILADVAGTFLTVKKAFFDPRSETTISWLLVATAAVFGALSIGKYQINLLIFPCYLAIANFAVPLAQLLGRSAAKVKRVTRPS